MKDPAAAYRRLVSKAERAARALDESPDDGELAATVDRLTREVESARARMTAFRSLAPLRLAAREDPERAFLPYIDGLSRAQLWGLVLRELSREIERLQDRLWRARALSPSAPDLARNLRLRIDELVARHNDALSRL